MQILGTIDQSLAWLRSQNCTGLCADSRLVRSGDAFIAWPGAASDGRRYVQAALLQGARACLIEASDLEAFGQHDWVNSNQVAAVHNLKAATAHIASAFYGFPSQKITMVGITGTNGKTSSSWWFASLLTQMNRLDSSLSARCAVVGTLGIGEPPEVVPNGLTTPDPVLLQAELARLAHEGYSHCAIEASSIGLEEHRLDGTDIKVAIYTNFTQDHLDYHGNLQAYWQAKRALFNWQGLAHAVINIDDVKGALLYEELKGSGLDLWSVAIDGSARLRAQSIRNQAQGLGFDIVETTDLGSHTVSLVCPIMGQFNVSNLLGVVAALRALGYALVDIATACSHLASVPGRMEILRQEGLASVVVDYAHTPDALVKTLEALRPAAKTSKGQLWCVFGCGGNRDASKRPIMAQAVERGADRIVVTSDNPRDEDPLTILADIDRGFAPSTERRLIPDRTLAIQTAVAAAGPQDIILLAGKGHEPYQEIKGERRIYSDIVATQNTFANTGPAMTSCADLADIFATSQLHGYPGTMIRNVRTDTRAVTPGDLFVALKGDNFDGHDFVNAAAQNGAVAALVSTYQTPCDIVQIVVPDTRLALGQLAKNWRSRFLLPVIGVTGSNGKTTVTQMIASILRAAYGVDALATQGNFNNDIGLPLTVLQLQAHHQRAVFEMGMNHPGEIAYLAAIAAPTVALVNNAQREHLEFMHTVENVAIENGACLSALSPNGLAVFPADDDFTPLWRELAATRQCLTFSLFEGADIYPRQMQWHQGKWSVHACTPFGDCQFTLTAAGRHNVKNALAALACALGTGISPDLAAKGLSKFQPVKGRSRSFSLSLGAKQLAIVDDSYNANPDSMRAAVDVLAELPGPRLLVVGDMGEVGDQGPQFHAELGGYAQSRGIDRLICTGDLSLHTATAFSGGQHFVHKDDLCAAVLAQAPDMASILVKGSRFMKMEQVIAALEALAHDGKGAQHVA